MCRIGYAYPFNSNPALFQSVHQPAHEGFALRDLVEGDEFVWFVGRAAVA